MTANTGYAAGDNESSGERVVTLPSNATLQAVGATSVKPTIADGEVMYFIEVAREEDGRFCATYHSADRKTAGSGEYSATAIGALAELCATLIKIAEDEAVERISSRPTPDAEPDNQHKFLMPDIGSGTL